METCLHLSMCVSVGCISKDAKLVDTYSRQAVPQLRAERGHFCAPATTWWIRWNSVGFSPWFHALKMETYLAPCVCAFFFVVKCMIIGSVFLRRWGVGPCRSRKQRRLRAWTSPPARLVESLSKSFPLRCAAAKHISRNHQVQQGVLHWPVQGGKRWGRAVSDSQGMAACNRLMSLCRSAVLQESLTPREMLGLKKLKPDKQRRRVQSVQLIFWHFCEAKVGIQWNIFGCGNQLLQKSALC